MSIKLDWPLEVIDSPWRNEFLAWPFRVNGGNKNRMLRQLEQFEKRDLMHLVAVEVTVLVNLCSSSLLANS